MSEPREAPSNRLPINQAALAQLRKAKVHPDPMKAYLAQLAQWGMDKVHLPQPISPQQPLPDDLREFVARLVLVPGPAQAERATRLILSNPNLTVEEQTDDLEEFLSLASDPEQAAEAVVEAIYDLMVVTAP